MAKIFQGESWIDNKFVPVTFIKAADCKNNKENYVRILQNDDPSKELDSEIEEIYMKFNVGYSPEWGRGFYEASEKGKRGSSLYYYAKTKWKGLEK